MRLIITWLLLLFLSAPGMAQSVEDEEAALRAMWERFEQYYEAGDAQGVASLYAVDADRMNRGGTERAVGRPEILKQYQEALARRASNPDAMRPYHADITIRFLRPDVAILDGISTPRPNIKSYFTVIATKENGKWWIAAGRPRHYVEE